MNMSIEEFTKIIPENETEKEILYNMKQKLEHNKFYLGGQLLLSYNDTMNMNMFNTVKEINKRKYIEYGPANSWEEYSIHKNNLDLENTEKMFVKYCVINRLIH
jgi:hypothetical protein